MTPRILAIAGSDSGGGAGIQADIKTVTMLGGHAMTAITAVTAQNTLGVDAVHLIPTEIVIAQIDACVRDIGVDAVKIGMIGSAETAEAVADYLKRLAVPIVFDPVMVATSGAALADARTIAAFHKLIAIAGVVTPNLPELNALGGTMPVLRHGCLLLLKGGHSEGNEITDQLLSATGLVHEIRKPRIATTSTHGTGCTLASALACGLGAGLGIVAAFERAVAFVRIALCEAPGLGQGHGPMGQQKVRLDLGPDMRLNQFVMPHRHYAASRDFYRKLGLTLIVDSPTNGYARFEVPGGATLSLHGDDAGVNFECDDLDARVAAARAAGIDFEGPVDQPWLWREAWTFDPSGNRVLLYQALENRRFPPWRINNS
ncbi:MAG: bifunctional hydroxymethylpyrimidine kinase/phosphomethylpyrimidine kinase [Sphingomonadaceae bacterium]